VAIGVPFGGMTARVVDGNLHRAAPGQAGELALSGPQLATGYWRSPDLTAARFPTIDGTRWYLTGDLAYEDSTGTFHHLGRIDNQVKVRGYRVELEEIEAHLRAVSGVELVAAVAWPIAHGSADGIVGFVAAPIDAADARKALRGRIPSYMVPSDIRIVDSLPLSQNGKVDRRALLGMLDREQR
jgi:acyl-CoA synthetase (AMP-forming)/AMP-acid ligase II